MSDNTQMPDELTTLKARADLMGIQYHPNIGVEKLREKIAAALAKKDAANEAEPSAVSVKETENQRRLRKKKEASELIRIQVTCMNPHKSEYEGEIFTAGNSIVGTFKKYVPFNVPWHVPRIIYNMIKRRQCQIFVSRKDHRGRTIREGKLINEFSVAVLPPLTPAELKDLAQRQAMANGTQAD